MWTHGLGCIGLQWLNRRALRELALEFTNGAQVPPTDFVRVEGWFGESAWQGNWKPLTGEVRREGVWLIFRLAPKAGVLQTQKIRWIVPVASKPPLVKLSAFTRSSWATTKLFVGIEKPKPGARGEVTIWNGELVAKSETRKPKSELSWGLAQPLRFAVRYSQPSSLKSDPTVLQFRLPTGNVGVAVEDMLENDCVYVPDHGLFVAREPLPVTLANYKQRIAGRQTILEEVRAMPDQTLAQAMEKTHHDAQREGPMMLSLACDNAKFVVERDGTVRFQATTNVAKDWFASAGELRPQFGEAKTAKLTRTLDGGWLPIPVITREKDGLIYGQRSFVAPCDEAGGDPARLNRHSVCVVQFTVTNTLATAADASLALHLLLKSRQKESASLVPCPRGWLVRHEDREVALVAIETNSPLKCVVSVSMRNRKKS